MFSYCFKRMITSDNIRRHYFRRQMRNRSKESVNRLKHNMLMDIG